MKVLIYCLWGQGALESGEFSLVHSNTISLLKRLGSAMDFTEKWAGRKPSIMGGFYYFIL